MTKQNLILAGIKRLSHNLFDNLPASVYLYGSRARGDYDSGSDWDLLIVADDSIYTHDAFEKFAFPFAEFGWKHGEQITPLLYSKSEWYAERSTSFYLNVQKEAILL